MPWTEQAQLLLRKARQDAIVVERGLSDLEISDEIVGFHVQQASEKCLKAVLASAGIAYRRTHDLQELCDLAIDSGISVPPELPELTGWSPFAVAYRYEDWLDPDPVDRQRASELTTKAIQWAESRIDADRPNS